VHEILRRYRIACNRLPKAAAYLDNLKGEVLPVRRVSLLGEALNERGRALSSPATHPKSCSNYFLTFAFLARAADP
jgi:hypothetical protein